MIDKLKNVPHIWYLYFGLLVIAIGIAGSHWLVNPYRLALWVYSSDTGHILIESRCEGQATVALRHKQLVTAGYYEYRLPLPKCKLSSVSLSGDNARALQQEISLATITYYGRAIQRLHGNARTLAGEGIFARDSRPKRTGTILLHSPITFYPEELDSALTRYWWPRWLPLFLLPLALWLTGRLAISKTDVREVNTIDPPYKILAAIVITLITVMAVIARTDVSVHPDELSHVASAHYYFDHWLKPKIGSPETLDAHLTNRFGVAYLTNTDPVYLLAGKFAVITWPVFQNDVVALRMFNVSLFAMLSLLLLNAGNLRLALIPFFLTPQAWYMFSYFNGDGLPLFLSTLAVVTFLAIPSPGASKPKFPSTTLTAILAGCLAALILLSKPNYWSILGVIALLLIIKSDHLNKREFALLSIGWILSLMGIFFYMNNLNKLSPAVGLAPLSFGLLLLAWQGTILARRIIQKHRSDRKWLGLAAALLFGCSAVIGLKLFDETLVNPAPFTSARAESLARVTEHSAAAPFKPSALANHQTAKTYKMHDQGIGLLDMLVNEKWFLWSFNSFLGVYGYMNIGPAQHFLYALGLMFFIATIAMFAMANSSQKQNAGLQTRLALLVGVVTVIAASIGFSWLYDFEPQGRYLLAILPIMGGGLVAAAPGVANVRILFLIILPAYILSVMSFLFIGLQGIPKLPGLF